MADPAADLYRRFEIEIRTPGRRLLVDAFLPEPASIESSLPAPEPVRVSEEDLGFLARRDEEPEPERPKRKPKARASAARKESARSLEEEVAEFMKRDRPSALAPDDDLDAPPPPPVTQKKDD